MPYRDIVVIGTSAGGVEALSKLCSRLPENLPAALFVVIHLPATVPSMLPRILSRAGPLPAVHPEDGERIARGKIYVAPPNHHLELAPGRVHITRRPMENGYRPSADTLFRSAAHHYGSRVTGIVLTGMLSDGAVGLLSIRQAGGVAIVQDPEEAIYSSMPENALRRTNVDYVLPVDGIAKILQELVVQEVGDALVNDPLADPQEITQKDQEAFKNADYSSPRTLFSCPDCGGVLWELRQKDGQSEVLSYACQIGHRYSLDGLVETQSQAVEKALWSAVRALEERALLTLRMASVAQSQGREQMAMRFNQVAEQAEQEVEVIRRLLERNGHSSSDSISRTGSLHPAAPDQPTPPS